MKNGKMIPHWTQTVSLGVMIGWCSLDSQHEGHNGPPANVGSSSFRHTGVLLSGRKAIYKPTTQIRDHKPENWLAKITNFHYTVISGATLKRGYRKIIIEI